MANLIFPHKENANSKKKKKRQKDTKDTITPLQMQISMEMGGHIISSVLFFLEFLENTKQMFCTIFFLIIE